MNRDSEISKGKYYRSIVVGWAYLATWIAVLAIVAWKNSVLSGAVTIGALVALCVFAPSLRDIGSLFYSYERYVKEQEFSAGEFKR